jgi:hypothetical protein
VIRFVDLTDFYWVLTRAEDAEMRGTESSCVKPVCAFVDTRTDKFLPDHEGQHVCSAADDVQEVESCNGLVVGRCTGLVPEWFWKS